MKLTENQIKEKKKVGLLNGIPVLKLLTKGGLNILASMENGIVKILGVGPMLAIAREVASNTHPNIAWELSKSEENEGPVNRSLIPKYTQLTIKMNEFSK